MGRFPLHVDTTLCVSVYALMDPWAASSFCLKLVFEQSDLSVRSLGDHKKSPVPVFKGFTIPSKCQSTNTGKSQSQGKL